MNVSGVIFFPSRAKETKKPKKKIIIIIIPDLRLAHCRQIEIIGVTLSVI